ncbi:carboxypeptidase M32 [Hyperthermus butylicus]|uniref:Metal-dependent carboxypeptidase n=1 Tax=Hyperthermus butylicus (strain DSM 5456 / JCM 9403 / PLM1-5) TaxID=415426 RepID=A2BJ77_HYPBU|nr:carboxypeptidase M32 [Hyperthermus butylicus]ABM80038.1 carboxypeptidase [Hyperthermus butylicus DSM 5456]
MSEQTHLFQDEIVKKIIEKTRVLWALKHALSLMSWDLETYMPPRGVEDRSVAFEELEGLLHRLSRDPELEKLVEKANERLDQLNDYERGVVRVMKRMLRIVKLIPEELARREAKVSSEATVVWREAKKKADFKMFEPYLKEIVEIQREKAERLGYEEHPYDALLDLYEEGLRTRDMEAIFSELVPATKRILEKVLSGGFYPQNHPLEEAKYDVARARELLKSILNGFEWPWDRGRLDESAHPFTIELGMNDVRITVRYEGYDIKRAVYSLVHEYGHALYELQIDPRIARTPIGHGVSMGVHESQSRFWENIVGRGPWFIPWLKERMDKTIGYTRDYTLLELYRYVNTVKPGLIRVDADEVTYNLHIYLRFTIEKKLIEQSLNVDEVPQVWDDMMEELLGVRPRNAAEGVLQDIHWSHGSIGYFPTYTLGNVIAAMIWRTLWSRSQELLRELRLAELRRWLGENIHKWGATYPPKELVKRVMGEEITAGPLIEYLEWKYLKLPGEVEDYLKP